MKWNKGTLLVVAAVLSVSFVYSSFKQRQLSNKVEEQRSRMCSDQGSYDCELISRYHDECFSTSNRARYKIKEFNPGAYNDCIDRKIEQHLSSLQK